MIASSSSTLSNPPELPVDYADVAAAADRLKGVAHRTPVLTSRTVDAQTRGQVFFKAENFQRTGSFKFRGAYNAIAQLSPDQKQQGVITYSSGNHAQAIALAGKLLEIPVHVAMPTDAPVMTPSSQAGRTDRTPAPVSISNDLDPLSSA